jgi:hypothetical protein
MKKTRHRFTMGREERDEEKIRGGGGVSRTRMVTIVATR